VRASASLNWTSGLSFNRWFNLTTTRPSQG